MLEIKTIKEQAIDHLSTVEGKELDMSCNLTSSRQLEIVLESEAHAVLGSVYVDRKTERMLRLTNGFMARHRQDIVEIAKSKEMEQQ